MTYPLASDERTALEAEYRALGAKLSPDELRVLIHQAERMIRIGHSKYGPLDLDTERRNWTAEMAAESSDRLFYEACREVAAESRRQAAALVARCDGEFADEPTIERSTISTPPIAGSAPPQSPGTDPLGGVTFSDDGGEL